MTNKNNYDVVIIGAGPAGMSAALYLSKFGRKVCLVMGYQMGGKINETFEIDNYLGYYDLEASKLSESMIKQIEREENIFVLFGEVTDVTIKNEETYPYENVVLTNYDFVRGKTLLIASGTTTKKLGVPGEDSNNVHYCATCDASFFKDKKVAMVGGGEVALEDTLLLSNIATEVHLFHRRNEFRAPFPLQEQVKSKDNVIIHYNKQVDHFHSEKNDTIDVTVYEDSEEDKTYIVDGVFVAIGQTPNNNFLSKYPQLLDSTGYVRTTTFPKNSTEINGVFAAGDIRYNSTKQVSIAVGDGAQAAIEINKYLEEGY